ncbi:ABC transporter permease [Eubacteriaceae bacterium ES2]|nr:ABC transporter permease [Eubacteriaceae bacterium ES2]
MRKIINATRPFVLSILHDAMMIVCILAPLLMGVAFRFFVPILENLLCQYFSLPQIITPYYILFDLMLAIMTPIMFCFSGVLVMLEEFDNGTAKYYFVTPVGKSGYLLSRLILPALMAFVYDLLLLTIFTVSGLDPLMILIFSICGTLMAVLCSLLVVAFAQNKMAGMALIKLCGILLVGIPVVYFVNSPIQYLFAILPSFWMAKISLTGNYLYILPTVFTSSIIIAGLYKRFTVKKVS